MPDDPPRLLTAIDATLAALDFTSERMTPNGRALRVRGHNADYWLVLWADEDTQWLACRCVFPTRVPEGRRGAAAEAVARLNWPRPVGGFDLDLADGELQFRVGADVEGATLAEPFVGNMIAMAVHTCEQHHDALMAVAFGAAVPAEVISASLAAAGYEVATAESTGTGAQAGLERPGPETAIAPDAEQHIDRLLAMVGRGGVAPGRKRTAKPSEAPNDDPTPPAAVMPAPLPNSYVVPGTRLAAGEYPGQPPGRPAGALRARLDALLDAGVRTVVDLTDPADGLAPYAAALAAAAAAHGVAVTHERLTIRDMDVCDAAHMRRVLDVVDAGLARGAVYVHCWGGVGRTGTAVGCWLVRHGRGGDDALAEVGWLFATKTPAKLRRHPEGSPQTEAQRRMVRGWAAHDLPVRDRHPRGRRHTASDAPPGVIAPDAPALGSAVPGATTPGASPDPDPLPRDRVRGALLGGAVGDAMGWPVEFLRWPQIVARYGEGGVTRFDRRAEGGRGTVTDDTQMTLFTAEGVLRAVARRRMRGGSRHSRTTLWHAYLRWLHTQDGRLPSGATRDRVLGTGAASGSRSVLLDVPALHQRRAPGTTCLSALASGRMGTRAKPLNQSKGCGGVMRVAPVALCAAVADDEVFDLACDTAAITHGHPTGWLAAGAFAVMLRAGTTWKRPPWPPGSACSASPIRTRRRPRSTRRSRSRALTRGRRWRPWSR